MSQKLHWGILGCGRIARTFATALNGLPEMELTAVAARDPKRAEAFAAEFQAKKAYGDYEAMAADPDVEVIYIAVPHGLHKDAAILCMKHGKHVLCEKPFALNEAQCREMMAVAKEEHVFLMEAFWTKFLPVTRQIRTWIAEGKLGKMQYIEAKFCYEDPGREKARLFDPALGGGALLDVGIYPIGFINYILDALPLRIVSAASCGVTGVDEYNAVLMTYPNGVIANFASAITMDMEERAIIVGTKARIDLTKFWRAQKATLVDHAGNVIEEIEVPHLVNGYEYEAEEVARCIASGSLESQTHSHQDTLNLAHIMDEIRQQWNLKYPGEA